MNKSRYGVVTPAPVGYSPEKSIPRQGNKPKIKQPKMFDLLRKVINSSVKKDK